MEKNKKQETKTVTTKATDHLKMMILAKHPSSCRSENYIQISQLRDTVAHNPLAA